MFGTVFTFQPNPGQEQAVIDGVERWRREMAPSANGYVANYLFRPKDASKPWVGIAIFDSEESYYANADNPAQDAWFEELRALLVADPEWNDGTVEIGS